MYSHVCSRSFACYKQCTKYEPLRHHPLPSPPLPSPPLPLPYSLLSPPNPFTSLPQSNTVPEVCIVLNSSAESGTQSNSIESTRAVLCHPNFITVCNLCIPSCGGFNCNSHLAATYAADGIIWMISVVLAIRGTCVLDPLSVQKKDCVRQCYTQDTLCCTDSNLADVSHTCTQHTHTCTHTDSNFRPFWSSMRTWQNYFCVSLTVSA